MELLERRILYAAGAFSLFSATSSDLIDDGADEDELLAGPAAG